MKIHREKYSQNTDWSSVIPSVELRTWYNFCASWNYPKWSTTPARIPNLRTIIYRRRSGMFTTLEYMTAGRAVSDDPFGKERGRHHPNYDILGTFPCQWPLLEAFSDYTSGVADKSSQQVDLKLLKIMLSVAHYWSGSKIAVICFFFGLNSYQSIYLSFKLACNTITIPKGAVLCVNSFIKRATITVSSISIAINSKSPEHQNESIVLCTNHWMTSSKST